MRSIGICAVFILVLLTHTTFAAKKSPRTSRKPPQKQELLIKLNSGSATPQLSNVKSERIDDQWVRVTAPRSVNLKTLEKNHAVESVQKDFKISLIQDFTIQDPLRRAAVFKLYSRNPQLREVLFDNPPLPDAPQTSANSPDPLLKKQWALQDINAKKAWNTAPQQNDIVVALLDTGIDYTHQDLIPNIWRNLKEIPNNGIDDDENGYIDDVIGWDFSSNDNLPFDFTTDPLVVLSNNGNPGHGTHVAGIIAASRRNGFGISGVSPHIKIMPLRVISEKGMGKTSEILKAVHYAIQNGAKIINISWKTEGDGEANKALNEILEFAQANDVLVVSASGHNSLPAYPAAYEGPALISVAASDRQGNLAPFSEDESVTSDIAAPGVQILSTTLNNGFSEVAFEKFGFKGIWSGTPLAASHVSGAAALYWSVHPEKKAADVKQAILNTAAKSDSLKEKLLSGGKLDVSSLLKE